MSEQNTSTAPAENPEAVKEAKQRAKSDKARASDLEKAADAIAEHFAKGEQARTAGAIIGGEKVQDAILEYIGPATAAKERGMRRAAALTVIEGKLSAVAGTRVDVERTLLVCFHLHSLFGESVKALGIGACKALQPVIKRDRDTEEWHAVAEHKEKTEKLILRVVADGLTAKDVAIKVAGMLGSKSKGKAHTPEEKSKAERVKAKKAFRKAREKLTELGVSIGKGAKDDSAAAAPSTPELFMASTVKATAALGDHAKDAWRLLGHNEQIGAELVEAFLNGAANAKRFALLATVQTCLATIAKSPELQAAFRAMQEGQQQRKAA